MKKGTIISQSIIQITAQMSTAKFKYNSFQTLIQLQAPTLNIYHLCDYNKSVQRSYQRRISQFRRTGKEYDVGCQLLLRKYMIAAEGGSVELRTVERNNLCTTKRKLK